MVILRPDTGSGGRGVDVDPTWAAVIGLAGILLGGAVEHFRARAQFEREAGRQDRREKQNRAERAFAALQSVSGGLGGATVEVAGQLMNGLKVGADLGEIRFKELEMLVRVYFPEVRPELDRFFQVQEDLVVSLVEHTGMRMSGKGRSESLARLKVRSLAYSRETETLANRIAEAARSSDQGAAYGPTSGTRHCAKNCADSHRA